MQSAINIMLYIMFNIVVLYLMLCMKIALED